MKRIKLNKPIIGYKAFFVDDDQRLYTREGDPYPIFQEGRSYATREACGYFFCKNIKNLFKYYPLFKVAVYKIKVFGDIFTSDNCLFMSKAIKILELVSPNMIKNMDRNNNWTLFSESVHNSSWIDRCTAVNNSDQISLSNAVSCSDHIQNSETIHNCTAILSSLAVSDSGKVFDSRAVERSHHVVHSKGVHESRHCYGVDGGADVTYSRICNGIVQTAYVEKSNGLFNCMGIYNCNGISNELFNANVKPTFKIFGKKVSKKRFEKVRFDLIVLLTDFMPITLANDMLLLKQPDTGLNYSSNAEEHRLLKNMPEKAIEYIKSLPEFDQKIFSALTNNQRKKCTRKKNE